MDKQNEKARELTREQMEKATGGEASYDQKPDLLPRTHGTDCFICSGTLEDGSECGRALRQISGKLYRCFNAQCSKFAKDQYPMGQ